MTGYIDNKIGGFFGLTEIQVDGLLTEWALPVVIGFLAMIVWHRWASAGLRKATKQFQDRTREIYLLDALLWVSEKSAWGRWYKSHQSGVAWVIQNSRLRTAAGFVQKACLNGDLTVRGRLKNSIEFLAIERDTWRSATIDLRRDNASIWKPVIVPLAGVPIPDYDDFLVERNSIEALWPKYEWKYTWHTIFSSFKSKQKNLSLHMPELEKQEVPAPTPSELEVIAAPVVETVQVPAPTVIVPSSDAPEGWENLFAIGDDGRSIWLRFLPDTNDEKGDALLLIIYGYKVILNRSRVGINAAHAAVQKTVSVSPSKTYKGGLAAILGSSSWFTGTILGTEDYATKLGGSYRRVGLSQGGMYELTEYGEREALGLANDLISRA